MSQAAIGGCDNSCAFSHASVCQEEIRYATFALAAKVECNGTKVGYRVVITKLTLNVGVLLRP